MQICEHLPMLAQRSDKYALIRSMATGSDGHEVACHMLLTGRLDLPVGFSTQNVPNPHEWPSMPALINFAKQGRGRNNLPVSAVLPEPSINEAGKSSAGSIRGSASAHAGKPGTSCRWRPNARSATVRARNASALREPRFNTIRRRYSRRRTLSVARWRRGTAARDGSALLESIEQQRRELDRNAETQRLDRHRLQALAVLNDPRTHARLRS